MRTAIRPWTANRRRTVAPLLGEAEVVAAFAAAPIWEVQPSGHREAGPGASVSRRDTSLRRGLAAVDLVAAFFALWITMRLFGGGVARMQAGTLLLAPFVLLVGKLLGLYDRDPHLVRKTTLDEAPTLGYLAVVYALGTWLGEVVLIDGYLTRGQVFGLVVFMFVLTSVGRLVMRRLALSVQVPERCIVLGNVTDAERVAGKFAGSPTVNTQVIGRIPLVPGPALRQTGTSEIPQLGEHENLTQVIVEHHVERVIIAPHSDGQDELLDSIRLIKALGVKVSVLPRLLEVIGSTSSFDDIDGLSLLGVRHFGLTRSSELIKRAADLIAAGLVTIVLGPLLLVITLAVMLDSEGPVFFRQARIGRRGDRFHMLKFRSMVADAEVRKHELRRFNEVEGGLFKIENDPRITRVGRFLRKTSLDELPQLLNVLSGDMSLVGPRPLVPDEDRLIEGWRRRRLAVKPGMTGLWQIFGSSRIPMHEMVKIDYIYGANWSLWLDLRILLRTVPYVLSRRGQ